MMNAVSHSAARLFSSEFGNLSAVVLKRLELECHFHNRPDLAQADQQLLHYAIEFGRLLNVVFRYNLFSSLQEECKWYATVFSARGSCHDAFALVLESWIMAVQGLIKPPECNELARPIQFIRDNLDKLMEQTSFQSNAFIEKASPALLDKLINGDVEGARKIISDLGSQLASPDRIIVQVILPAMAEIGQRWEFNQLEIFQEHLATETIRSLIAGLTATIPKVANKIDKIALVTCCPGDEHDLIPLALASYLELRGWSVKNLGGGLPATQIAQAVRVIEPEVLFLTFTMLSRLDDVLDVIVKVQSESKHCRVIIGGHGAMLAKEILESKGALVAVDFDDGFRLAEESFKDA